MYEITVFKNSKSMYGDQINKNRKNNEANVLEIDKIIGI